MQKIPLELMDYEVNSDVNWRKVGDSVRNMSRAGLVTATEKITPFSLDYAFEMTVVPVKRTSRHPGDAGICLVSPDKQLIWRVLLVDNGKKRYADLRVEGRDERINRKSCDVKCVSGNGFRWQYGKPYRLYIECRNRVITSKVSLDGKTLVSHTAKAPSDVPYICGFHSGAMLAQYSEPAARWGEAAKVVRKPLKLNKPVYVPSRNISGKFRAEPTGFFYTKQDDKGYWWLIDPAGNAMFACGADGINWQGRSCEALGYSEYNRSVRARFDNEKEWMFHTKKRLEDWGFNFAGTCSNVFRTHIPFANNLMIGSTFASLGDEYDVCPYKGHVGTALPNPFHPRFGEYAKKRYLRNVGAEVENPYFLGYYCDNELRWEGATQTSDGSGVFDTVMKKNSKHTAKIALVKFLERNFKGDIKSFNDFWGVSFKSFEEIAGAKQLKHSSAKQLKIKQEFLTYFAETYFRTIRDSLREIDPNHLFLGCRYAGIPHDLIWKANAKYCDVISFNVYPVVDRAWNDIYTHENSVTAVCDYIYNVCKRPAMITEWAFLGFDSGLPCVNGAGQRFLTQRERAAAAGSFYRMMLGHKAMIGMSWYEYGDDPALGVRRRHPQNCNYGLVNKDDVPYRELVDTFRTINQDVDAARQYIHSPRRPGVHGNLYRQFEEKPENGKKSRITVENNGREFLISNGEIAIRSGKDGVVEVLRGKRPMGYFYTTLYTSNKNRIWRHIKEFRNVKVQDVKNGKVVFYSGDIISANGNAELTAKIFVPEKGSYVIPALESVKNTGAMPLDVGGFYFQVKPLFDHLPPERPVPYVHYSSYTSSAWVSAKSDYLGVANSFGRFLISFYVHNEDGLKGDCLRRLQRNIKPGEVLKLTDPAYLFIYTGKGAYLKAAEKLISDDMKDQTIFRNQ